MSDKRAPSAARPTVLQVIPALDTGGAERTTIDVAAALVRAGGRALVMTSGGRLVEELRSVGGEVVLAPVASKNPATLLANAARIGALLRRETVDIVHARSRAPAWSALWAARLAGVSFVTTYHGAYNQAGRLKAFYNSVMARGDAVIANSAWTARLIAERHPQGRGRVVTIPRGTDLGRFDPATVAPERVAALRAAWGVPPGVPVLLHLARLTGWKGQTVTIEVARRLRERGIAVMTVLAGDAQGRDAYAADLAARIGAADLGDRVRLVGHCEDAPAALAASAAVLVPSLEPEAFGRAAVEAEAMGVPVVVSDAGGAGETVLAPPEVTEDERTGWRVPPGDIAAATEAVAAALALGPEARAALGARARAHVLRRFTVESMSAATLAVYARLLEQGAGRAV